MTRQRSCTRECAERMTKLAVQKIAETMKRVAGRVRMRTVADTMRKDTSNAEARINRTVKAAVERIDPRSLLLERSSSSLVGPRCGTMLAEST